MDTAIPRWKISLVLGALLLLGLLVRSYNLDFPSIGYHNMKENESLSIAQAMRDSGDFLTSRVYFYDAFGTASTLNRYRELPLVPYQVLTAWSLFGENLWGPRLFNIFFSLLSVVAIYFIAVLLFNSAVSALTSAFLFSIMPLSVFYSRNLQPESPAFLFMLLGNLFYLRFTASSKKYNLLLGGFSFCLALAYKTNFIFGALPVIFCLPFRRILRKKRILSYTLSFLMPYLIFLPVLLWQRGAIQLGVPEILKSLEIFSPSYWQKYGQIIFSHTVNENYTPVYSALAFLGILLAFLKGGTLLNRYIVAWVLTLIPFGMAFREQLYQQGFSQMPFLILICVSSIYTISFLSEAFNKKNAFLYLAAVLFLVAMPFVYNSIYRMHATVFLGEDVAGGTLKELTEPGERVFLFTHAQGYGIARYAQRYMGWPLNLKDFREKEEKFKIRYICIYPSEYLMILKNDFKDIYKYIEENYHVKELGLLEEPDRLVYFILEKGKGQRLEDFLKGISGQRRTKAIYHLFGRYIFLYSLRP